MSDMYVPEDDITETTADGRVIQIAAKGVPISLAEAQARGFVKAPQPQGPSEVKADDAPVTDAPPADAPKSSKK